MTIEVQQEYQLHLVYLKTKSVHLTHGLPKTN